MELKTLKELYKFEDLNFNYWSNYMDLNQPMSNEHRINKLITLIKDIDDTLSNAKKRGY